MRPIAFSQIRTFPQEYNNINLISELSELSEIDEDTITIENNVRKELLSHVKKSTKKNKN